MATKTVQSLRYPVGTAVKAYPWETTRVEQREGRVPFAEAAHVASGTIDANNSVSITADPGKYVLLGVVNEVQSVAVDATLGQFKLVFEAQTTADIAFDASPTTGAASVRALLEALSTIGTGNVTVSGGPGGAGGATPYLVTFVGALAGKNVAAMTSAAGTIPLSGGGAAVVITTGVQGAQSTSGGLVWVSFTVD